MEMGGGKKRDINSLRRREKERKRRGQTRQSKATQRKGTPSECSDMLIGSQRPVQKNGGEITLELEWVGFGIF